MNPGPGTYNVRKPFAKANIQKGNREDEMKRLKELEKLKNNKAGDIGGLQYPILPSAAPHFSILGRPGSDVTSDNHLHPKKTRDPGPG